jgi:Mce-associated membrane protein
MTELRAGITHDRPDELEKDPAAVRSGTDTVTDLDDVTVVEETTESVEGETKELSDAGDSGDVEDSEDTSSEGSDADRDPGDVEPGRAKRQVKWSRVLAFGVLPVLALLLAMAAGYLKWQDAWVRASAIARTDSLAAAKDGTVALLSYQPNTVEKDLGAARDRLTGPFKESYGQLTHDVVIPGAKQQHISAIATVPAAASVSATPSHAVVLVFVNQTAAIGADRPTDTASSVRVSLDKVDGRWLICAFDPV